MCHLIATRIRKLGVLASIISHKTKLEEIKKLNPKGIILSGGPSSIYEKGAPFPSFDLKELDIPILGICYGCQLIGSIFGGKVEPRSEKDGARGEYGVETLTREEYVNDLFLGIGMDSVDAKVVMSHGDSITELPKDFYSLASTKNCKYAAISSLDKKIYGVQFHPEVKHTNIGDELFNNFISICGVKKGKWNLKNRVKEIVEEIKTNIKDPVIMAVSGGVDSTVAATLIENAVPELLHCVFVNNGLLRFEEEKQVVEVYEKLFKHFTYIDASDLFLNNLKDVSDPETKRKIIGKTFIEIFDNFSKDLEKKGIKAKHLGQGTIYPDVIESSISSENSEVIKSHHNVGGLPEEMNLSLIEPLKDFYKDEVREIGNILEISSELIQRKPFPGPGLGIRCIGTITKPRLDALKKADLIFLKKLKSNKKVWESIFQAFVVLLPVKTVGVMGDSRTYDEVCALRCIDSTDAMTGTVPEIPWEILHETCKEIVNQVKGINRVVFDLTGKVTFLYILLTYLKKSLLEQSNGNKFNPNIFLS